MIRSKNSVFVLLLFISHFSISQQTTYQANKKRQLTEKSPFQDEIDGKFPERIVYQDKDIVAFKSISPQLPVHILVVPRKRISTLNDAKPDEARLLGRMLLVAKDLAKKAGIDESGYRISINTNEDAGQSVFHIHMHLLGGIKTGAMVDQYWRNTSANPGTTYKKELEIIRTQFLKYYQAWLKNDQTAVMNTLADSATIILQGQVPIKGKAEIEKFWFPKDGSVTTMKKFDCVIEDIRLDNHQVTIRSSSVLSFEYEKNGVKTIRENTRQTHLTVMEKSLDENWLVIYKMWTVLPDK